MTLDDKPTAPIGDDVSNDVDAAVQQANNSAAERLIAKTWLSIPLWTVTVVAGAFTLGYVLVRAPDYVEFWRLGARVRLPDGSSLRVPFTRLLVDLTFVLMGIAFIARHPPQRRNASAREILIAALGGCLPMLPHFFDGLLGSVAPDLRAMWRPYFMERQLSWWRTVGGVSCLLVGNAIDVWAYSVLMRSFSVIPEARALVTRGPYRWVRHPVYAGQLIAQAGIWFFFAVPHGGWVLFWMSFLAIQLYRSRVEERVLVGAFGDDYRAFAKKARWFWPFTS